MELKDKVLAWFGTGQVGCSSKAMALAVCNAPNELDYPRDPGDLNRCLLFLDAVPEARAHMDKIAAISPVWARLVEHWDELEASFLSEAGRDWSMARSAPETYKLMLRLIEA